MRTARRLTPSASSFCYRFRYVSRSASTIPRTPILSCLARPTAGRPRILRPPPNLYWTCLRSLCGSPDGDEENPSAAAETAQSAAETAQPANAVVKEDGEGEVAAKKEVDEEAEWRKSAERKERVKNNYKSMLLERMRNWQDIQESLETFPYYLSENTRDLLIECVGATLLHWEHAKYGNSLPSSSHLIRLCGPSGTEIFQEKLVQSLARHLRASLLILESDILNSKVQEDGALYESKGIDDEDDDGGHSGDDEYDDDEEQNDDQEEDEDEDEDDDDEDDDDDEEHGIEGEYSDGKNVFPIDKELRKKRLNRNKIQKLIAFVAEEPKADLAEVLKAYGIQPYVLKTGDKVKGKTQKPSKKVSTTAELDLGDDYPAMEAWLVMIEALCEIVTSQNAAIVYFPDFQNLLAKAVTPKERPGFVSKIAELLKKVDNPVVFISGMVQEDRVQPISETELKFMHATVNGKSKLQHAARDMSKIFRNKIKIFPPQEGEILKMWKEQLERDRISTMVRRNQKKFEKVLRDNELVCAEIAKVDTKDFYLTNEEAELVVGWARNSCLNGSTVDFIDGKLIIPLECLEGALSRLRTMEPVVDKAGTQFVELAENAYERSLLSCVIPAREVGVHFDQIGALDDVKNALRELIILPLQRPELFRKGNLRKPCKGVLLFGPPGTGKTLLAKAVATEAGANFINITSSNLHSKWFGEAEKLTKALFTLARKLTPAVIFMDEVDSVLGARGRFNEHEGSRKVKNELMAAWDGLQSKEMERIIVLAATNRPFDLDDAVIRRLPRRIFIDLPNTESRIRILRIILQEEELVEGFDFNELAAQTEGYSGSDLKNLCVAAAYRPLQEFLKVEDQAKQRHPQVTFRPLSIEDFIETKSKVGHSVVHEATSMVELRQWNEQYGEGGSRQKGNFGFMN